MRYEDLSHEARELALYVENERAYCEWADQCRTALAKRYGRGSFSIELAPQAFAKLLASAGRNYHMEHGSPWQAWHTVFTASVRREVAELFAEQARDIFRDPRVWGDLSDPARAILERYLGVVVHVTGFHRLNCSAAGNPRFDLPTTERGVLRTSSDAACSYDVENWFRNVPAKGKPVRVWLTGRGLVEKMALVTA